MATRKAARKAAAAPARPARGQVGQQTYEQVCKLVAEKKIPLVQAFKEVAEASGRQAGTIAVTYYRIARVHGATGRGRGGRRGRGAGKAGDLRGVLRQISSALAQIEKLVVEQAQEIDRLSRESEVARRIRRALRR